jgi:hypothetical protein
LGFKNGLAYTISHTFGWVVAIVVAFFSRNYVAAFIKEHTTIYDRYTEYAEKLIRTFLDKYVDGFANNMPDIIGNAVNRLGDFLISETAVGVVEAMLKVLIFIGIILLVKLILFTLTILVSRRHRSGFVGGLDGLAGMLIGMIQGIVIVFILLAALMPAAFTIDPEYCNTIAHMLKRSIFSDILYYHNPLLDIINGYLPDELLPSNWLESVFGS